MWVSFQIFCVLILSSSIILLLEKGLTRNPVRARGSPVNNYLTVKL